MRPRIRFSLRSLLVFTAVAAGCCYWLVLPSVNARRFVAAAAAGDYALADRLFADPDDRFLEKWDNEYTILELRAQVDPFSWRQFWRGERQVSLHIAYRTPARTRGYGAMIVATRAGLGPPQRWPGGSDLGAVAARDAIAPPPALPHPPSCL